MLSTYVRFAKNLFLLSLFPVALVYMVPSQWVAGMLGEDWTELMPIARIMVIWLAIWFVSSSLSFIFMRLQKQRMMMSYDLLHLAVIIIGFFAGRAVSPTFEGSLWGFSIAQAVFYIFIIGIAIHLIRTVDESIL